jgi:hypothetical protein
LQKAFRLSVQSVTTILQTGDGEVEGAAQQEFGYHYIYQRTKNYIVHMLHPFVTITITGNRGGKMFFKEYIVVQVPDLLRLMTAVNCRLQEGWLPLGAPFVDPVSMNWTQAMVKELSTE